MTLYKKVKDLLPDVKAIVSDDESLLLNRKDYHISQISPVNAHLISLGIQIGYPYRVLLSFLDQFACGIVKGDFNVIISDPSLTIAGYYCWMRAGGNVANGRVYAPKGIGKFPERSGILGELLSDFGQATESNPNSRPETDRQTLFTFVLGNTKKPEQTIFAADRFTEVERGILILKDYSRVDAFDEREYCEGKLLFPSVTFEGHAFVLKN